MPKNQIRVDQLFSLFFCGLILILTGSVVVKPSEELPQLLTELVLIKPAPYPVITASGSAGLTQSVSAAGDDFEIDLFNHSTADVSRESASEENFNPSEKDQKPSVYLDQVTADSFLVLDVNSAKVLLSRNQSKTQYPASTVKLMTALVALETYDLDQVLTAANEFNIQGNKIGLRWGAQLNVRDLITAILVNSGNDAAQLLANQHPQGYEGFVQAMNDKAQELHLRDTVFKNPTGLDDLEQVTTSYDLSVLARAVLSDPFLNNLVTQTEVDIFDLSSNSAYRLYSTNALLHSQSQVRGIKTGTTPLAGEVLVTLWEEQQHPVVIVVMNASDRYNDTMLLIEWLQNNVTWQNVER